MGEDDRQQAEAEAERAARAAAERRRYWGDPEYRERKLERDRARKAEQRRARRAAAGR